MFKKILIANRGEIALRIMRACRELDIACVAIHSTADMESLHVKYADESVCVGRKQSSESYLNIPNIIAAAEITGVDAIHPGYGFLAENAEFADICNEDRFTWIGPPGEVISRMGDKAEARKTAHAADVPTVPGSPGLIETVEEAEAYAAEIGYPVIIKATAGGGGKGLRVAKDVEDLRSGYIAARTEAGASFGNDGVYVEKFLSNPRHVEIQILGDKHGNVVYLGERDCSVQRRLQKLIEEAPSPAVDPALRVKMGEAAVKLAQAVGYDSAGTVEFLLDEDGSFYFMEMNTRIQVEHPVTEMVTGIDLLKYQIAVAANEPLDFTQEDIRIQGHSIECRINAENPARDFMPCPGRVFFYHAPGGPGVRVDSHVYSEYSVPPYYDSLLAKIITHGRDRDEALVRMKRALEECVIEGVPTSIPFHIEVLQNETFRSGQATTKFLDREMDGLKEAIEARVIAEKA